jgi:hypothetical protein
LTSSWLSLERNELVRARAELSAAERVLEEMERDPNHPLLVVADLLGGVTETRAGSVTDAMTRLAAQKSRYDSDDRVQANWVAALEGEIALAQGKYDAAVASFRSAETPAWETVGNNPLAVFALNSPSRDGRARVEVARGNRAAAIEEYRRLTAAGPGGRSAALEPRHVLALARLLTEAGDTRAPVSSTAGF